MRRFAHLVVIAVSVGAMTGCSTYQDLRTSKFAKQDSVAIVAAARKAMQDVTSMRLTGHVRSRGNQIAIDVSLDRDHRCAGTMRLDDSSVSIRRVGNKAWLRGDTGAFARLSGSTLPRSTPTKSSPPWIPANDKTLLRMCDLKAYLNDFEVVDLGASGEEEESDDLDAGVPATVGEEIDMDGVTVVPLTGSPGGRHDEISWVRTDAPHYVVRLESTSLADGGTLTFSDFNDEVLVEAPRPREVLRP